MTKNYHLLNAMYSFLSSAKELHHHWSNSDDVTLPRNYPFDKSFDEVVQDIQNWVDLHQYMDNPEAQKQFFIRDKTGRCFTTTVHDLEIDDFEAEAETFNVDAEELQELFESGEIGEQVESSTTQIIRIK